ncbi:SulP family inorganic anion transporter [Craterilacuibacter sp. RT1T]|uniref:SulP family inorganic anion transporter n=1 Tax=Craterilacuibacter sp. RT1T TaxID=2942211 RepID=UPI0020BF3851|nr:SulP family inorganic anion transporter [Craterilacuibacter sp. RT1T]MCL6263391.1 SulP family inorganic anion transporter [Craterilacuibacter sp. RT1T]
MPPWLGHYQRNWLTGDISAGVVVTLLLVPQALAYAMVAGLPPQTGLYASLAPLLIYALLGRSHAQSVGPMAVTSLLVAATLSKLAPQGGAEYAVLAVWLALLSGLMLLALGLLRLGLVADFLSQPVLSGFVSASALMIVLSQLGPLLGSKGGGATLPALLANLWAQRLSFHAAACLLGGSALLWLLWSRRALAAVLCKAGLTPGAAQLAVRAAPVLVLLAGMLTAAHWGAASGLRLVGEVPSGLPPLGLAWLPWSRLPDLVLPAFFIALVNMVQSLSVAQILALPRRESIAPDRELIALGACNIGAALSGGFPVTGGLTRSVVNADAGAQTQLSSLISALLMTLIVLFATQALFFLPLTVLSATIVASVLAMIDFSLLRRAWACNRADALAFIATFAAVLLLGVDSGIIIGLLISLGSWVAKSGQPHIAKLGRLSGSEHFRNVRHFSVETLPATVFLRVDESLYFGNARHVEAALLAMAAPDTRRVVLVMSGVNRIDLSALLMLERLDEALAARSVVLWLSDIKRPVSMVMDKAALSPRFDGRIFLSASQAWQSLAPQRDYQI